MFSRNAPLAFGLLVLMLFVLALQVDSRNVAIAQERPRSLVVDKIIVGDPDGRHVEITAAGVRTKNVFLGESSIEVGKEKERSIRLSAANDYVGLWMEGGKGRAAHLWSTGGDGCHLGFFSDYSKSNGCEAALGVDSEGVGALQLIEGKKVVIVGAGDLKAVRKPK